MDISDLKCPKCSDEKFSYKLVKTKKNIYQCKKCSSFYKLPTKNELSSPVKFICYAIVFAAIVLTEEFLLRDNGIALAQHLDIFSANIVRAVLAFILYLVFTRKYRKLRR